MSCSFNVNPNPRESKMGTDGYNSDILKGMISAINWMPNTNQTKRRRMTSEEFETMVTYTEFEV